MKESVCKSYDELPLFLNTEDARKELSGFENRSRSVVLKKFHYIQPLGVQDRGICASALPRGWKTFQYRPSHIADAFGI